MKNRSIVLRKPRLFRFGSNIGNYFAIQSVITLAFCQLVMVSSKKLKKVGYYDSL